MELEERVSGLGRYAGAVKFTYGIDGDNVVGDITIELVDDEMEIWNHRYYRSEVLNRAGNEDCMGFYGGVGMVDDQL